MRFTSVKCGSSVAHGTRSFLAVAINSASAIGTLTRWLILAASSAISGSTSTIVKFFLDRVNAQVCDGAVFLANRKLVDLVQAYRRGECGLGSVENTS